MPIVLTDGEIADLVGEPKELPIHFDRKAKLKARHGHMEGQLDITGESDHRYHIRLRQSQSNALDFSIVLGYYLPGSSTLFRLRRYNGKAHYHTNRIERQTFYDFHIHMATERYQRIGAKEEGFALPTDRYATIYQAFECLRADCRLALPGQASGQGRLFS